jgi:DNA-binding NarL/FixJ family response regulator
MPNVDGYSLLLHVKKHHPRIPFVLVTAVHDAEVREEVLRDGADGYLLKPFTRDEFVTFVRRALATSPKHASQHTGSR